MTAAALLADLQKRDVVLAADGDALDVDAPLGVLTSDLRAALVALKPELLRLLRAPISPPSEPPRHPADWPATVPDLGPKSIGPFVPCGLCGGVVSWVRYGDAPRCRDCARDPRTAVVRLYQRALRRWWELIAQGPEADRTAIKNMYQEIIKLADEVGEPRASTLSRRWARAWQRETGFDPWSGERDIGAEP